MAIVTKSPSGGFPGARLLAALLPPWWTGYFLSLVFPLSILGYLVSGPHTPTAAAGWTLPMWLLVAADRFGPDECRVVPDTAPRWFFDGILYLLVPLQWANVWALGGLVARLEFDSLTAIVASGADLLAIRLMVGANFTCAGLCPAHELIHRRPRWQRCLGRSMLVSLCYDHFAIAHKRVHHARLGTPDDPSTARDGECFEHFFRRAVAGQWRIAWAADPLGVVSGLGVEALLLFAYASAFGALATAVYLFMVFSAVRTLESVNYFQHYGLTADSGRASFIAWRCDSAISLFLFLGLTRHADHHRHPARTYAELRPLGEGPKMPHGYLGMAVWTQRRNDSYRAWAASLPMTP